MLQAGLAEGSLAERKEALGQPDGKPEGSLHAGAASLQEKEHRHAVEPLYFDGFERNDRAVRIKSNAQHAIEPQVSVRRCPELTATILLR